MNAITATVPAQSEKIQSHHCDRLAIVNDELRGVIEELREEAGHALYRLPTAKL